MTPFATFPDEARLWLYAADAPLPHADQETLLNHLHAFFQSWVSHGRRVQGAAALIDDRILAITATLQEGDISGCGIDASVHAVESLTQELDLTWLPGLTLLYRDKTGSIQHVPRAVFRQRVRSGQIDASTPVFDLSLQTLGDLRAGRLEQPAGQSWHSRVFRIPQPA